MNILVTGGAGFIGSHQTAQLLQAGYSVTVVDNLVNASIEVFDGIETITGKRPNFYEIDVLDTLALSKVLVNEEIDGVIHFAALKSVPESVARPVEYHHNNLGGLVSVLRACGSAGVRRFVFSSSGSVYGETDQLPIVESHPHRPVNPYSATKSISERILSDLCLSDDSWSVFALRYFNPAGANPSGLIGENPIGPRSNLLPFLVQAALADHPKAAVYGDDYNTPDGSGIRDYVHVEDVALTHIRALELADQRPGFTALNVGRGVGVSVHEMIAEVEKASGKKFEVEIKPRRPGDVSSLYGDTTLSQEVLGPIRYRDLAQICEDAWRWETGQAS